MEKERPSRPPSHKWAFVPFVGAAAVNILLVAGGFADFLGVAVAAVAVLAILFSITTPRSKVTYGIGTSALVLIVIRALQSLYFHISPQNGGPASWVAIIGTSVFALLLFYLLYHYARGEKSRAFFGLGDS